MKLYHGTDARLLSKILLNGLSPRGNRASRWKRYASRSDCVYLTRLHGFYFANRFALLGRGLVIEIDSRRLDATLLLPDEDYVSQARAGDDTGEIAKHHRRARQNLLESGHLWSQSIQDLGTCAYAGAVPREAITRYCLVDLRRRPALFDMCDTQVSLRGTAAAGRRLEALTSWFFGDRRSLPKDFSLRSLRQLDPSDEGQMFVRRALQAGWETWKRESGSRRGIRVVVCNTNKKSMRPRHSLN